ncbi:MULTISPECIES: DUF4124 domain-containing protein [Candidatus Ichthyocystis]|uniref:DUF4124 domain-containing protein n=1 Tax=Candidatus Ichthyocystis TaxID=2929841 RepID=UPI000B84B95E|nr:MULTISPECIES: DUF4124 domain-containing protein [Ichthyocystis]
MKTLKASFALSFYVAIVLAPINLAYAENSASGAKEVIFRWTRHDEFGNHVTYSDLPPVDTRYKVEVISTEISFSSTSSSSVDAGKSKLKTENGGNLLSGQGRGYDPYKVSVGYVIPEDYMGGGDSSMSQRDMF